MAYVVENGLLLVVWGIALVFIVIENVELDLLFGLFLFHNWFFVLNGGFAAEARHKRVSLLKEGIQGILEISTCAFLLRRCGLDNWGLDWGRPGFQQLGGLW